MKRYELYHSRLPFNWHSPMGYLISVALQWTLVTCVCFSIMIVNANGTASYLFATAITNDIKCVLKAIDKNSKSKKRHKHIYKQFTEFLDLHSAIKRLGYTKTVTHKLHLICLNERSNSHKFFNVKLLVLISFFQNCVQFFRSISTTLHGALFTQPLNNMLCNVNRSNRISWVYTVHWSLAKSSDISVTFCIPFVFQSHDGSYSKEILFLLGVDTFNTFIVVYIACELCQRLSNSFDEINDLINQFRWYRFPIETKRILPMALVFVQKPVSLECFGSFSYCREALKKVNRINSQLYKIEIGADFDSIF